MQSNRLILDFESPEHLQLFVSLLERDEIGLFSKIMEDDWGRFVCYEVSAITIDNEACTRVYVEAD